MANSEKERELPEHRRLREKEQETAMMDMEDQVAEGRNLEFRRMLQRRTSYVTAETARSRQVEEFRLP